MNARLLRISIGALILGWYLAVHAVRQRIRGIAPQRSTPDRGQRPDLEEHLNWKTGATPEMATRGSAFTCKTATVWVKNFIKEKATSDTAATILKGGPKGYTCKANTEGGKTAARGSCL